MALIQGAYKYIMRQETLLYLPVDLPPFPDKERLLKVIDNINCQHDQFYFWERFHLAKKTSALTFQPKELDYEVLEPFPDVITWINALPKEELILARVHAQNVGQSVDTHYDFIYANSPEAQELYAHNLISEPCGYRALLRGSRKDKLYVQKKNGQRVYCALPETTDTYLIRQTDGLHGVDIDDGRAVFYGHIRANIVAHNELVACSLEKYSQFAVWDDVTTR